MLEVTIQNTCSFLSVNNRLLFSKTGDSLRLIEIMSRCACTIRTVNERISSSSPVRFMIQSTKFVNDGPTWTNNYCLTLVDILKLHEFFFNTAALNASDL